MVQSSTTHGLYLSIWCGHQQHMVCICQYGAVINNTWFVFVNMVRSSTTHGLYLSIWCGHQQHMVCICEHGAVINNTWFVFVNMVWSSTTHGLYLSIWCSHQLHMVCCSLCSGQNNKMMEAVLIWCIINNTWFVPPGTVT